MFDSMKILVDLAPKIREDKREEIVEILEVAYFNAKNTSISVEYCKHYVDILLTVLDMNPSKCLVGHNCEDNKNFRRRIASSHCWGQTQKILKSPSLFRVKSESTLNYLPISTHFF